jgi:uncharacterized repeat protein (TIGR03803 family)
MSRAAITPRPSLMPTAWKSAIVLTLFWAAMAIPSPAQTFTKLADFDGTNGADPVSTLVEAVDGNFYGQANAGGDNNGGVVFKFAPGGSLTAFYTFCKSKSCPTGSFPLSGLVLSHAGILFGTAGGGGANQGGTVFKITTAGAFRMLYSFCTPTSCPAGDNLYSGLVQARDGNFYGAAYNGGAYKYGTIYQIAPTGQGAALYSFCPHTGCADGAAPAGSLIQGSNANLYGTTAYGGANGKGTIFEITTGGTLTTLYSFCAQTNCADGELPYARLLQASDGNIYGTTPSGGAHGSGTVFKLSPGGVFTTLYNFCSQTNCTDGAASYAELIQATDGNLYGTTQLGGANNLGTIFEITPTGTLTTLHSFDSAIGGDPIAGLVQGTDGSFYGTTAYGAGSKIGGTVFNLHTGLAPFVKTLEPSGKVGSSVTIFGNNLTSATGVTFNGTTAAFTVVSSTQITATIPAGATSGKIQVVTSANTLSTTVAFHVLL